MTSININILLRALAILSVVFNHAYLDRYYEIHHTIADVFFGLTLDGGAVLLMLLSGYNFAQFNLSKPVASEMRASILKLAKSIFIPSFLLVVFFFIILHKFNLLELLFVRNFVTQERIAKFPTWYPQVITQILLVLYLVLPLLNPIKNKFPLLFSVGALLVSVLLCVVPTFFHQFSNNQFHLPIFYLWIFTLGWVIYAFTNTANNLLHKRILASSLLIAAAALCLPFDKLPIYWIILGGLALIWLKSMAIPAFLKTPISIVAQATFTLFLFHRFAFEILQKIIPDQYNYLELFAFGLFVPLALWLVSTALVRSYKQALRAASRASLPAASPAR